MFIVKTALRTIVIGGLAVGVLAGGSLLVAGPERTAALFNQGKTYVNHQIDAAVDETTAMREKLRRLEREYPKRITQVSADLAELRQQMSQIDRERRISERVVSLTGDEVARLESQIGDFDAALQMQTASHSLTATSALAAQRETAMREAQRVRQTQFVYQQRAEQAATDLGYLGKQAQRLEEALTQLENERTQFQTQLMQIERQIDAIDRNDRMIEMMEKRQRTLDEVSRYDAFSIEQVTSKLSELRSRQEAELELLTSAKATADFEDMARFQLERESIGAAAVVPTGEFEVESDFRLAPATRR
jgi:chromosome segregation ATPase